MKNIQKWGGISAIYLGAAYILGMIFFLVLVDYMSVTDPIEKMSLIGMETVINLFDKDPIQAATVWIAIEAVHEGIGGGNEIVGGIWILLISLAALELKQFPKSLNIIGIIVGCAGILSTIPPLGNIAGMVFGLIQIIWFIWLGIFMIRRS
ncbi:MAG: hypothetical protein PF518_07145 [Spirochaetaceae bacterium]|jgi:hypothetical protein|nr:hypothetical protein [Spirochaetaceae bacterium]